MTRHDRDGWRRKNVSGIEFDAWLQGGLDECCSLYAVMNAFSYLFALDKEKWLPREYAKRGELELLRRYDGFFWNKIRAHWSVREYIANAYIGGAYPRDVEELAEFVNKEIFGGSYYCICRSDSHGSFSAKDELKALESLNDANTMLKIVLVKEDENDEIFHWIVLVYDKIDEKGYRSVIDSNRGYFGWKLDDGLLIHRENEADIKMKKVHSAIAISRSEQK